MLTSNQGKEHRSIQKAYKGVNHLLQIGGGTSVTVAAEIKAPFHHKVFVKFPDTLKLKIDNVFICKSKGAKYNP